MNFQQLEYILAVDRHRHFLKASESCFVTQATLSMMIRKLEDELGVKIFDRSRQPVQPTETGKRILEQARNVMKEVKVLENISRESKTELTGSLRIGIIQTLAPYLLPLFIGKLLKKFPGLQLHVHELTTDEIVSRLSTDQIDVGIMATPLQVEGLKEQPLFSERLLVYVSPEEKQLKKKYLLPRDINPQRLWLLEEGHCLRSQMLNLCSLRRKTDDHANLHYAAGSIESVMRMAELSQGITIVPELATLSFSPKKKTQIRAFKAPEPVREISLVTYRHFVKEKMLDVLGHAIREAVNAVLPETGKIKRISLER